MRKRPLSVDKRAVMGSRGMHKRGELNFIGTVEAGSETEARVRIFPEFCEGLREINAFSHLIVLYWIHLRDKKEERRTLQVFPRRHSVDVKVGVFACRSPSRPNPIGLCVVELIKIEECTLTVKGLDALEASPIIDIKPYIPRADSVPNARVPKWTSKGPST
jgi:tRNA-Thr(GGU) m(6)t(6)A37 methyltransferase TsaA